MWFSKASIFLLWLDARNAFAQNLSGILNTPSCSAVPQSKNCEQCVVNCWPTSLACALVCHLNGWNSDDCQHCLQRFPNNAECHDCIADCFQWNSDRPSVCVDCNDPNLQRQMCLGSFNQLGFCTTPGSASFADNGGPSGTTCKAPTADCDVIAGAISNCAASPSLFVLMNENQSNSSATGVSNMTSSANPTGPTTIDSVKGWKYQGCYTDSMKNRVLIARKLRSSNMTVRNCAEFCKGYQYFGVEYSNECYCGNTLSTETKRVPDELCDRVCMADYSHYCGGSLKLGLYKADDRSVSIA